VQLYLTGSSGVLDKKTVKVVVICIPHRSRNTYIRRRTTEDQVVDPLDTEHQPKFRMLERAAARLVDNVLIGQGV